jgi:ArsR family transcriptional regulator
VGFGETFKALSDPVRRKILVMLKEGKMSAGEIAEQFDMTPATISYHLSQLKKAGLLFETKYKNYIYYEINVSVFEELMLWFTQFGGVNNEIEGWKISQSDIYTGLAKVKWPGRFEVLSESPYFVVDGAHNSHGVDTLVNSINKYFSGRKITFLTGVMKDKDYEKMFDMVAPYAEKFIAVQPDSPRALNYQELGLFLRDKYHIKVIGVRDVQEGIKEALMTSNTDDINIAFGSLYMVGQIREFFIKE